MSAALKPDQSGTPATSSPVRLRSSVFDERAEHLGAETETAKAELVDTDRKTLWRYRVGLHPPGLDLAMRWAKRLGVSVDELWEDVS